MRKYLLALLVGFMGITLIGAQARATETNFSGELRVRGEMFNENTTKDQDRSESLWDTRLRLQMDFAASDDLKGVYQLEIGDITWGDTDDPTRDNPDNGGGRFGTDEVNVETRQLYIDANLPNTPLNAKAGLMQLTLGHGFVFDETAAALLLSANVDPVKVGLFTMKAAEGGLGDDDGDVDYYGLVVDATLPDLGSVGLFGVYGRTKTGDALNSELVDRGRYDLLYDPADDATYNDYDAYWIGLTADLAIDPLVIAFEADYYNASFDASTPAGTDFDSDGYLLYLDVGANLEPVKVGVAGLYATGNDDDTTPTDGDSEGFTPILPTDPEDNCVVNWDNLFLLDMTGNVVSNLMSFKVYAEAAPMPELNVGLSVQYYALVEDEVGTADSEEDYIGTEIDLDLAYNVYDQLTYEIQAAYMFTDDDVFGPDSEDIWFLSHKLIYSF